MRSLKLTLAVCLTITSVLTSAVQALPVWQSQRSQIKDPKIVSQKLYKAWQVKSRRSALKLADKTAVDKLFSVRRQIMKFEGCTNRDEGGYECIFRNKKLDLSLAMILDGGVSAGGYNVVSLSFSSEE